MTSSEDTRDPNALLGGWTPPPRPERATLSGQYVRLDPLLGEEHGDPLYTAYTSEGGDSVWDYLAEGPFPSRAAFDVWLRGLEASEDPLFFAVKDLDRGAVTGLLSLLRINPASGSIEVGYITFSPLLQRTRAATEAIWLLMEWSFANGYRRFEWKCNALNAPSRRAAQRFGLSYEGIFRQATVVKGRNRDTAWYAAIDGEFSALKSAFEGWLAPGNFDETGMQRSRLADLTKSILVRTG